MRLRKFDPQSLFLSVLHLATSTNREGYEFALQKTWENQNKNPYRTPVRSSLSEARGKVSFKFFKEIYEGDLKRQHKSRRMYRGFYVYAVDGTDLELPATQDVISEGYRGSAWNKELETYYPRMYTVHAYDVVNEVVRDFKFSNRKYELRMALDMVKDFERNSIAIYDRLYCGYTLIAAHKRAKNYFLVRARAYDATAPKPVKTFLASNKREMETHWYQRLNLGLGPGEGIKVRLIKIRNPRTKEDSVFVTNLPKDQFTAEELSALYRRRWEVETSFRDLTSTFKMGQWHSKKMNGILQEIYALLWFVNAVKMQMNRLKTESVDLLETKYTKAKFKLCAALVLQNIALLIRKQIKQLVEKLDLWIRRTRERRERLGRNYPRVTHASAQTYPLANQVRRRPKLP